VNDYECSIDIASKRMTRGQLMQKQRTMFDNAAQGVVREVVLPK